VIFVLGEPTRVRFEIKWWQARNSVLNFERKVRSESAQSQIAAPAKSVRFWPGLTQSPSGDAPTSKARFHWYIIVGCTPNRLASSLTVPSPFSASNATFALNSGRCCFRFDMSDLLCIEDQQTTNRSLRHVWMPRMQGAFERFEPVIEYGHVSGLFLCAIPYAAGRYGDA